MDDPRREFGTAIVRELATEIRTAFDDGRRDIIDTELEQRFRAALTGAFPGDAVIGEELTGPQPSTADSDSVLWILDPLDGTSNFRAGLPIFAVSLAAVVGAHLEHGWILDVMRDTLWSARRGQGAWRDADALPVAERTTGHGLVHLSGRWQRSNPELAAQIAVRDKVRSLGSVAVEMAQVAEGTAIAGLWSEAHLWDIAAGLLICSEAGVEVGQLGPVTLPGPRGPWRRDGTHTFHARHPKWASGDSLSPGGMERCD